MHEKLNRALLCLAVSVVWTLQGVASVAQGNATFELNIAEQPLTEALKTFAQQSGLQVVFYTETTSGYRAPEIRGRLTRDEALTALLKNTALTYRQINSNTVEVAEPRSGKTTGDPSGQSRDLRLAQAPQAEPPVDAVSSGAPPTSDGSPDALEEILVTAQKREERLEDVPVSITVFTRSQIEKSAITRFEDYANFTPGLNAELGANERSYEVTIRGIGQLGGQASNFGLYLDEFELTGSTAGNINADLADVERIEVLRGPQGTAFGRNVIAGAVNITSIAPSSAGFFGSAEVEAANHAGRGVRAAVNIPLAEDVAALRLSASHRENKGYLRNVGPSGQSNDYEHSGFRAALRLTPTDRWQIDAAAAMQKFEQGRGDTVNDGHLIGVFSTFQQVIDAGLGALPPGSLPAGRAPYYPEDNRHISTDTRSFLNSKTSLATLRAQYDLESFSLVSVSGYVHSASDSQGDYDDSEYNLFVNVQPFGRSDFWSTELRAQSNGDSRLGWIGGLYYSEADASSLSDTRFGSDTERITTVAGEPLFPNDTLLFRNDIRDDSRSSAVFGELSYRLTSRWQVLGGLRYNDDRFTESQMDSFDLLQGGPLPDETRTQKSSKVTGRASVQFEPADAVNLYATFARGYRAGGIQLETPFKPSFGPEVADNYELGLKSFLWGRRVSLNTAAFFTNWQDVQISTFDFSSGRNFTDNVGRAEVYGMEVEVRAVPVAGLEIEAGVSLLHTQVKDFINGDGVSLAGYRLPNAPNFTSSVVVDYEHPVRGSVKGFVRASWLHMSNRLESLDDPDEFEYLPAYDLVDLRIGLRGQDWTLEAFGENVFDEIYSGGVLLSGFSLTGSGVTSPRPSYGVRLLKSF